MKYIRKIIILFFCGFFLSPTLVHSQTKGHGVEVRLTTPKLIEADPGKIITGSFQVLNNTDREEEFLPELNLPPDWQVIVPPLPFRVKAQERQIKVFAVLIPATFSSGRYDVTYSVKSQRDYGISDSDTFSVAVLPSLKLQMFTENQPQSVIAGETYSFTVRLGNRGNCRIVALLDIKGNPDYPIKIEQTEIPLEAGESRAVEIEVKTDDTLTKKIYHFLQLRANPKDPKDQRSSVYQTVMVEILPRISGETDKYYRLNSQLRLISAGQTGEDSGAGFQAELSGYGNLDEGGKHKIDFLFRSPDVQKKSIFGERDEYRISYYQTIFDIHLGDRSYSLSPLAEYYRYGRGTEVKFHPGKFGAGAFYLKTRWEDPDVKEVGTYVKYQFSDSVGIKGNFLQKNSDETSSSKDLHDSVYTVETKINPNKKLDLELEYGQSSSDRETTVHDSAYRIDLRGQFSDEFSYAFDKIHAEPKFFGYYNDQDFTTGSVTFPMYQKLRGNASFRSLKENLDSDPSQDIATRETSYRGGISYAFPYNILASLDYEDFQRKDRLTPSEFDFHEKFATLGLGQTFRSLTYQLYAELGELDNKLSGIRDDSFTRYSLFLFYSPNEKHSYGFYGKIGPDRYSGEPKNTSSYGISAEWNFIRNLNIYINYQRNEYVSEDKQKQDQLLSTISYILPNGHTIDLKGRWHDIKSQGKDQVSFLGSYTVPLGIPVGVKKNSGRVTGQVYDAEKSEKPPIPNVVLTMNGESAVTNAKGEFIFPALKPGSYLLRVERGSIGLHRVATEKEPLVVEVKEAKTAIVEIGVATSCKIYGSIVLMTSPDSGQSYSDETEVSTNTLIEVRNEKEVLRQMTDTQGRFSFNDLRPGVWTIKFYPEHLPYGFSLDREEYQFVLRPGEGKEVNGNILKRPRQIQMIDSGEIQVEKKYSKVKGELPIQRKGDKKYKEITIKTGAVSKKTGPEWTAKDKTAKTALKTAKIAGTSRQIKSSSKPMKVKAIAKKDRREKAKQAKKIVKKITKNPEKKIALGKANKRKTVSKKVAESGEKKKTAGNLKKLAKGKQIKAV